MPRGLIQLLNQVIPLILLALIVLALSFGFMLILYLILFGFIFSLLLYIFNRVKTAFFAKKKPVKRTKEQGRIIDSNDYTELK